MTSRKTAEHPGASQANSGLEWPRHNREPGASIPERTFDDGMAPANSTTVTPGHRCEAYIPGFATDDSDTIDGSGTSVCGGGSSMNRNSSRGNTERSTNIDLHNRHSGRGAREQRKVGGRAVKVDLDSSTNRAAGVAIKEAPIDMAAALNELRARHEANRMGKRLSCLICGGSYQVTHRELFREYDKDHEGWACPRCRMVWDAGLQRNVLAPPGKSGQRHFNRIIGRDYDEIKPTSLTEDILLHKLESGLELTAVEYDRLRGLLREYTSRRVATAASASSASARQTFHNARRPRPTTPKGGDNQE